MHFIRCHLVNICAHFSVVVFVDFTLDVNNFEEDGYADDTSEAVAQYILDQLITSVTASVGMCNSVLFYFLFLLCFIFACSLSMFA